MFSIKKSRKANNRGFSLLELLMTAVIVPIISFVVFANFSSGMKLWAVVNQPVPDEDLTIFSRKTASDFLGILKFSLIPFTGSPDKVSFAAAMSTKTELGADRGIGEVSIFYDPELKAIVQEDKDISEIYKGMPGRKRLLLKEVEVFNLSFFSPDSEKNPSRWSGTWDAKSDTLPQAVRFEFQIKGSGEKQSRTFSVPVGAN